MIRDFVASLGNTTGSQIALIIFLLVFAGIVYWTLRGGRHRFDRVSRLPLEDNDTFPSAGSAQRTRS